MPRARERSRKESSHTVEREQEFRMKHYPDRPLKEVSHRDIPREADFMRRIRDWKTGEEQPPIMRNRRRSRNLEIAAECMNRIRLELEKMEYQDNYDNRSLRQRRGFQEELALNPRRGATTEYRRMPPEHQYVSQQTLLPKTTYTSQSMTTTTQSWLDISPSPVSSPIVYTSPSTQSSPARPQSPALPPFVCPLCRSQSRDSQDGLCNSCKAEFTMSTSSSFYEDEESILHSSTCFPHGNHLATKARCEYSSSVYSSSVYSLDTCSSDDRKSTESPVLLDDADDPMGDGSSQVPNTRGPECYQNLNRGKTAEREQFDLYDLDWADYYFDEDNFALKGARGEPG